jgi:hypothetical protein
MSKLKIKTTISFETGELIYGKNTPCQIPSHWMKIYVQQVGCALSFLM